jgi:hypothetical protein
MTTKNQRLELNAAAQLLWSERYPSAGMLLCGGSRVLVCVKLVPGFTRYWRDFVGVRTDEE